MPASQKRKAKRSVTETKRSAEPEDALQWISSDSEREDYGDLGSKERWGVDGIIDSHRGENDRMSYKVYSTSLVHTFRLLVASRYDGTGMNGVGRMVPAKNGTIPAPREGSGELQTLIRRYEAQEHERLYNTPFLTANLKKDWLPFLWGPPSVSKNFWLQTGMGHALAKHQEKEQGDLRAAGISMFDVNSRDFARGEWGSGAEDEDEDEDQRRNQLAAPQSSSRQTKLKQEPGVEEGLPPSPSLGGSRAPSPTLNSAQPSWLNELPTTWSSQAESVGATKITFTNNSNTPHAIPKLTKAFVYSEKDLDWGFSAGTGSGEDALVSCQCDDQCSRPDSCECQGLTSDTRSAYSAKGMFRGYEGVVMECNKACPCSSDCRNRIAQQPRSVPLDIFTPSIQGWGVRPLRPVKTGQVLGTYTGQVISKEVAQDVQSCVAAREMLTGEKILFDGYDRYLFDLNAADNRYTLNCWAFGNWTRFINCDPNLRTYSVCYDMPVEPGLERLGVVAIRDIGAREELTIDYCPTGNTMTASTRPRELIKCSCGAQACRGMVDLAGCKTIQI
ncbi:hypothetical protein FRC12_005470 [Ceratobasidium sp. 428]|nr:hypothetical protein FRC12_005470 [Ceratobasidium sp. 428]